MFKNKLIIFIFIAVIIIVAACSIIFILLPNISNKQKDISQEEKPIFTIEKISLYSNVSVDNNSLDYDKAYWNIDISQFSDIAIYINNKTSTTELTPANTVKSLFIDNVSFLQVPNKGTPSIFYKKYSDFGTNKYSRENIIRNDVTFNIVSSGETNLDSPTFYSDCSNPITIGFENKNIVQDYILLYDGSPLTYNGSVLKKADISLDSIATTLSFNINITNNLDETFSCNVIIPIELSNEKNSIYSGDFQITQHPNFIFNKI